MVKEVLKKGAVVRSSQHSLDFPRILDRFINRPLREQTGMDHEETILAMMKGTVSEPVDEMGVIVGCEDIMDRVFRSEGHNTF